MTTKHYSAGIIGVGSYVPPSIRTNDDIAAMGVDTSDEWIRTRTGISQRHIANDLTTADLATEAAKNALAYAGLDATDIDLIIVATATPDYLLFPSVACLVQNRIGATKAAAFDLSAACSGFIYAMTTAAQFIQAGSYKNIIVIGAEVLSKFTNWEDRNTCVLFGDGAGAIVLGPVEKNEGILAWDLGAKGSGYDLLMVPYGGTKTPLNETNILEKKHYIDMDGKAVFKFAVSVVIESIETCLNKCGLNKNDLDFFIPHQANKRIIDFAAERLGLPEEKVCVNITHYGNTSAATIPIALDESVRNGHIKKGDIVATMGFGAGLTWGSALIKWTI